jgi:hypothetical protein
MFLASKFIDEKEMTYEEVTNAVEQLKALRSRMAEARARKQNLYAMVENLKEEGMTLCSALTGEVFNPNDWLIYDERSGATYEGKWNGT